MFISIEKERKKKHLARRLSSVIILFNTVINVYITYGRTFGPATKYSRLDGLLYFLEYGGSACALCEMELRYKSKPLSAFSVST